MCLRFVFLLTTRLAAGLRLSRREEMRKTAEILILRHQLAVRQRRQPRRPKLTWAHGPARGAARRDTQRAPPGGTAAGHPGHDRGLAPRHRRPPPGRQVQARQDRPAGDLPEYQGPGPPSGPGEPRTAYRRFHGELAGLGARVSASTVGEILKTHGTGPAPRRTGPAWPQSLRPPAETVLACDFFTGRPARRHPGSRPGRDRARRPAHPHPRSPAVSNRCADSPAGRNLLMDPGEQAHRVTFMIGGRGPDVTSASGAVLACAGIQTVPGNARTPRRNAITERWTAGCRRELLDRTLVWNRANLQRILREYETHRNHRVLTAPCTPPRRCNHYPNRPTLSTTTTPEDKLASAD
jgi:putative transposase